MEIVATEIMAIREKRVRVGTFTVDPARVTQGAISSLAMTVANSRGGTLGRRKRKTKKSIRSQRSEDKMA